jgi:hypothetical protein
MRLFALIALIAAYFTLPFFLLEGPEGADNHFVKTLRIRHDRSGHYIELDRTYYHQGGTISTFAEEELNVDDMKIDYSVPVSVRGSFVTEDKIHVSQYHVHSKWFRSSASYLGLFLVSILCICTLARQKFRKGDMSISSGFFD